MSEAPVVQPDLKRLSTLLQLEAEIRGAQSIEALRFVLANSLRRLLPYDQALIFSAGDPVETRFRLETASSVAVIDRNAPFVQWTEDARKALCESRPEGGVQTLDGAACPEELSAGWKEFARPYVLWVPLQHPDGSVVGGLWLGRDTPWQEAEGTLAGRLADTAAHAWRALVPKRTLPRVRNLSQRQRIGIGLTLLCLALFPIRMSTLAPVEVVAKDPMIVSAPMDGVVASIEVPPNTWVSEGQEIFAFEDTNFRNQFAVAEKTLAVTLAEFRTASQGAFLDSDRNAQVALLKSKVELSQAERDYARELLDQVVVRAEREGLLLYSDKSDWIGRPVAVGERIMQIADPKSLELRIDLPVDDAIVLYEGADVKVFLDVDPLRSHSAIITHASHNASPTAQEVLAYRVDAEFAAIPEGVRIGLQGTAKVYGERVSLLFYLLRRPIAAARQFLGL